MTVLIWLSIVAVAVILGSFILTHPNIPWPALLVMSTLFVVAVIGACGLTVLLWWTDT
jgi:hypothetical protein